MKWFILLFCLYYILLLGIKIKEFYPFRINLLIINMKLSNYLKWLLEFCWFYCFKKLILSNLDKN